MFLNLDACHPETEYLCEDLWLFFEDKGVRVQKCLGNANVEQGSAKFGRTAWRGKGRIRNGRIFQEYTRPSHYQK